MSDLKPWIIPEPTLPSPTYQEAMAMFSASLGEPVVTQNPDGSFTHTWGVESAEHPAQIELTKEEATERFSLNLVTMLKAGGCVDAGGECPFLMGP